MYNLPGSDNNREWIEVYGNGITVDMSNWRLEEERINGVKTQHKLNPYQGDMIIEDGEYAVIVDDPEKFLEDHPGHIGAIIDSSFDLLNSACTLRLLDRKDGREIDSVFYINSIGADGNGKTLIRDGSELREGSVDGGTPGS